MTARRHARPGVCGALAIAATCLGCLAAESEDQGRRSGGPPPTRETPSASRGQTRDEMMRRFDLDANGRIDEGEAEAARGRMRRDRIDAVQNSGVDPLTGRLRGAGAAGEVVAEPPADDGPIFPPTTADDQPRRKPDADAERKPSAKPPPALPPGRAPAITGGVRAGAPAVRPGYGAAGPKQELNAGRARQPQPTTGAARVRPGVQPADRPPPQPGTPRAAGQRPSLFPQGSSQPSAEDFGR